MFQPSRLSRVVALTLAGIAGAPDTFADMTDQPATLEALNITATRGATKTETPVMETP